MTVNEISNPAFADITETAEVREAWLCPHLSSATGGPGDEHYREGTVVRLDGPAHRTRRRAMARVLSRGGHKYFRDTALFPTADAALEEILGRSADDGYVRLDLVPFARRISQQLAAALVGLDGATTAEGAAVLHVLLADYSAGKQGALENSFRPFDETTEAAKKSIQASALIRERFYVPAYARRIELAERLERGEITEDQLPADLLMLMALRVDPAWADDALRQREAVFVLGAGVRTSSFSLAWTLEELFSWLERHPEDRGRLDDDEFLLKCVNESLRLHPVTRGFARRATAEVQLQNGTRINDGQLAVIRNGPAGLDPALYGEDARDFNPRREVPRGISPYGFAFGAGAHLCYGAPIVMGSEGIDGSLVYLLKKLIAAGVEPDPEKPRLNLAGTHGKFDDGADKYCWVRFPARR
ncbi:MAG TPA: cytochrome P450 [Trebonia sp.]|jgi:cytochrome P450|nr:cytochrome P450 [Trebonia sp.]